jgi:hypothetical protein
MKRRFVICIHKHSGGQIEKNEMGGAWSTYGRQERYIHGFGGETHLEDGRMKFKRVFKKWDGEAWTGLIWRRIGDRWRTVVSAVMYLLVP